jgi:arylformamidase
VPREARILIDVSRPIHPDMPVYPGDPAPSMEALSRLDDGDDANCSRLTLGNHTGTHVDAPRHVLADGAPLGDVPLERLVGPARVVDLRGRRVIDAATLAAVEVAADEILLCRTDNSARWGAPDFATDFVHLSEDAAVLLVERGVRAVGVDGLSVDAVKGRGLPVHRRLLAAGVLVIEGLDLGAAPAGRYTLVCLPLHLPTLDGAPARAVLLA